jgi:hypothetical protein
MKLFKGVQVALTGQMRSGKDTVGKFLIEKYGFKRFAFGDGIVRTCQNLFPSKFLTEEKPRELLQEFGQFCVSLDKNVWVNYLFKEMMKSDIYPVEDNVVITDLRKQRIISSGEKYDPKIFNYVTEQFVKTFEVDFEIENNGTKD